MKNHRDYLSLFSNTIRVHEINHIASSKLARLFQTILSLVEMLNGTRTLPKDGLLLGCRHLKLICRWLAAKSTDNIFRGPGMPRSACTTVGKMADDTSRVATLQMCQRSRADTSLSTYKNLPYRQAHS